MVDHGGQVRKSPPRDQGSSMTTTTDIDAIGRRSGEAGLWGPVWLGLAVVAAVFLFRDGLFALTDAWGTPEYTHGPVIPILSAYLLLHQLKAHPPQPGPVNDRWPGVALVAVSILIAVAGSWTGVGDIVAYALILWVGGMILVSFGWRRGRHFWPAVLHLVFMLPLPGFIHYQVTTELQLFSSQLGVEMIRGLGIPVLLDGNIIDLGAYKLAVAEACSGLRYLFPIMSFSYVFAALYRGPMWHKAVLLISAAPITVFMNSVRIAVAGYIVNEYGASWVDGFTHFFEGWVIFIVCVLLLFLLARIMLFFRRDRIGLIDALDLDTDGLGTQAMRLRLVRPSRALIVSALIAVAAALAWQTVPTRGGSDVPRQEFATCPASVGEWRRAGRPDTVEPAVEQTLAADDYYLADLVNPAADAHVNLFIAWYDDQSQGGVHSPEICLPGAGWEIAWLERTDVSEIMNSDTAFNINRAIIQKGESRMMVYYWFEQKGRRIAWDFAAKFWLMVDGIATGRTDGGLVRLTTVIRQNESDEDAEARLRTMMQDLMSPLQRFVPTNS